MPLTPEEVVNLTKVIDAEVERQLEERMAVIVPAIDQLNTHIGNLANLMMSRVFGSELPETVDRFWRDAILFEAARLGLVVATPEPDEEAEDDGQETGGTTTPTITPRPRRRG